MGSKVSPKSCAKPLNGEQRKAPSVGCGSDEAEGCLEPTNGSFSSNAPGSDSPFSLNLRKRPPHYPALAGPQKSLLGLEPSVPKCVMRSEVHSPPQGLVLQDPLLAGF